MDATDKQNNIYDDDRLPPEIHATPTDLPDPAEEGLKWWRPSWRDILRSVGWRWILLTPVLLVVLLPVVAWLYPGVRQPIVILGFKLSVFVGAVAISLAGYVVRRVVKARNEPFCIHCGYNLSGLPDHYRCPECGRRYEWRVIAEYRRDPNWFIERWRAQRRLPPASEPFSAGPVRRTRRSRDGT